MKIYAINKNSAKTQQKQNVLDKHFGKRCSYSSQSEMDEDSFIRRYNLAKGVGFSIGIIALGLGILWIMERVRRKGILK